MSTHDMTATSVSRRVKVVGDRHLRLVGAAALAIALAMLVGGAFSGSPARLAGGIQIDGVAVGGLSPQAAVAVLERRSAAMASVPVTFVSGGQRFSLTPQQLGVTRDWSAAVASAGSDAGGPPIIRGFRRLELDLFGSDITAPVESYGAAVSYELGLLATRLDHPVREARLVRHGLDFSVLPGSPGRALELAQAQTTIVDALASPTRSGPVTLPVSVEEPSLGTGALASAGAAATRAVSAPVTLSFEGRHFELTPAQLAPMLAFSGGASGALVLGGHAADAYFAHLQSLVGRPARGAHFSATASRVTLVPASQGVALNVPSSAAAVLAAAERSSARVASLVVDRVSTGRTTAAAAALGITGLVGSYETVYGGVPNRIHNVALVAQLINGKLIAPGATFSFNQTTGARTAAKGFLVAPVIINGELATGLGGGVCQVSTTVFNAAFVAGLPITARTNHALYISHYPLGRDATVNYPNVDLRFVNDTPHWLLLRTFVGADSLVVSLFGAPQHRRVVSTTAPLTVTGKMPIAPRLDKALAPGQRVIIDPGMPPTTTSVQRWVYAPSGKLLSDETWLSNYDAVPEVVAVGPRHPKPVVPAKPTTPATGSSAQFGLH